MGLLSMLRSVLGLGGTDRRSDDDTTVTVERERTVEPETATESAVKGVDDAGTGAIDAAESETADAAPEDGDDPAVEETASDGADDDAGAGGEPVDTLTGIGPAYAERLGEAGVETVADLAAADAAELADDTGISRSRIDDWIEQARGV